VDANRAERIRELVRIVQESGVGEIEIEDDGMRVSVRRAEDTQLGASAPVAALVETGAPAPAAPPANGVTRVESPMVGVFYRASQPGAPAFVEVGDVVTVGQTLCVLEAMKLFNELKAELDGRVKAVHAENAQPVEFGQLLFELEPISAPPAV
jgi:oxaloacetate decarboxylase alpha subunit